MISLRFNLFVELFDLSLALFAYPNIFIKDLY